MDKSNEKGFTLIELLAVVVIMGILSVVAVSAVTRIMENTRKDMFVNTAKEYIKSVKLSWNGDDFTCGNRKLHIDQLEPGEYYILIDTRNESYKELLEDGGKSPWGKKDIKGYVKAIVSLDELTRKFTFKIAITDGIHSIEENTLENLTRNKVLLSTDEETLKEIGEIPFQASQKTTCSINGTTWDGGSSEIKLYGDVNKIGTKVKIGTELFRIINTTSTHVNLISEYNLLVGNKYDDANGLKPVIETGKQDPTSRGYFNNYSTSNPIIGTISFANTPYWNSNHRNILNSNSNLSRYINEYGDYLTSKGISNLNVRLLTLDEAANLGYNIETLKCENPATNFICNTSFWMQDANSNTKVFVVKNTSGIASMSNKLYKYKVVPLIENGSPLMPNSVADYNDARNYGIRPVISLNKNELLEKANK